MLGGKLSYERMLLVNYHHFGWVLSLWFGFYLSLLYGVVICYWPTLVWMRLS